MEFLLLDRSFIKNNTYNKEELNLREPWFQFHLSSLIKNKKKMLNL